MCCNRELKSPGMLTWGPYSFQHESLGLDGDKPSGFDSSEIGTDVVAEGEFRIQHHWSVRPLPINHPMSKGLMVFPVPFRGEKGEWRQSLPGTKGGFSRQGLNAIMV